MPIFPITQLKLYISLKVPGSNPYFILLYLFFIILFTFSVFVTAKQYALFSYFVLLCFNLVAILITFTLGFWFIFLLYEYYQFFCFLFWPMNIVSGIALTIFSSYYCLGRASPFPWCFHFLFINRRQKLIIGLPAPRD